VCTGKVFRTLTIARNTETGPPAPLSARASSASTARWRDALVEIRVALQSEACLPDSFLSRSWWREQRERSSSFMPIVTESGTRPFGLGSSSSF
jgi:hypothetical protein